MFRYGLANEREKMSFECMIFINMLAVRHTTLWILSKNVFDQEKYILCAYKQININKAIRIEKGIIKENYIFLIKIETKIF